MKLIIDVKNALYRMGWHNRNRTNPHTGSPLGPTYGFFDFLRAILHRFPDAQELILACDPVALPALSWRRQMYPQYKIKNPDASIDALVAAVKENLTLVRQLAQGLPCTWLEDANWEADDLIADVVGNLEPSDRAVIVSQDQDMLQLAGYPNVQVAYPKNGNYVIASNANFSAAYDIIATKAKDKKPLNSKLTPRSFVSLKCITGDKSDNITGIIGVALKRGIEIIHYAAEAAGGMEHLPTQPAQVFKLWIDSLPGQKNGGPKWAHAALRDNPQAYDTLTRNYGLVALMSTGRVVTTQQGFKGHYQQAWLEEWFRHYNFHEFLTDPRGDYLFGSLQKLSIRNA